MSIDYQAPSPSPQPLSAPMVAFLSLLSGIGLLAALSYAVRVFMLLRSLESVGVIFVFWYGIAFIAFGLFCVCGPTLGFTFPWRGASDRALRLSLFAASGLCVLLPLAAMTTALLVFNLLR